MSMRVSCWLSFLFRPFDADLYEDEGDEDDVLDEEGRARLKLKVGSPSLPSPFLLSLFLSLKLVFNSAGGKHHSLALLPR